jgi:carbon-monoxide dehydrogenase medium subunit
MKPARFDYIRPASLTEALDVLRSHGEDARILAGGQSLVPMLNLRLAAPALLVDINRIPGLGQIVQEERGIRVGALVRHAELLRAVSSSASQPLLAAALPFVAHQAVRNRGTVCGSLTLADPASELPACALCLGAEITLASTEGQRVVPGSEFFTGLYETAIRTGEMMTDVLFPRFSDGWRFSFEEVTRRHGDFAIAGLAGAFRIADAAVAECRLAFFGVSDRPVRSYETEAALVGMDLGAAPTKVAAADIDVLESNDYSAAYKRHLMGVLLRRALSAIRAPMQ